MKFCLKVLQHFWLGSDFYSCTTPALYIKVMELIAPSKIEWLRWSAFFPSRDYDAKARSLVEVICQKLFLLLKFMQIDRKLTYCMEHLWLSCQLLLFNVDYTCKMNKCIIHTDYHLLHVFLDKLIVEIKKETFEK